MGGLRGGASGKRGTLRGDSCGGCYSILVRVRTGITLTVGRLGRRMFPSGYYVYTGRDARGVDSRIRRHLSKEKPYRWHIDYLTSAEGVKVLEAIVHRSQAEEECDVNQRICNLPGARILFQGFGSSDCRRGCGSHLVYFEKRPCLKKYAI